MSYFNKKKFTMRQVVGLLTGVFLGITVIAYAAVTVPNTFTSGTTISSSQVNANFTALGNAMPAVKAVESTNYTTVTSTSGQNILSLTVTPPVNGYIILTGSGDVGIAQSVATNNYAYISLTTTSGAFSAANSTSMVLGTSSPIGLQWVPLSITAVFPVTGGVATTFYLTAMRDATGSNTIYVGNYTTDTQLTALFVPGTALP